MTTPPVDDGSTTELSAGQEAIATDDDELVGGESRGPSRPSTRRHLVVFALLVVAFIVGATLVVSGRNDSGSKQPQVTTASAALRWLGTFPDDAAAKRAIAALDPSTLQPRTTTPTTIITSTTAATAQSTGGRPTAANARRCETSVSQQSTDRNLGKRAGAAALAIGRDRVLVLSFQLPASGSSAAGTRIMVADVLTCKVRFAIDRTPK